MKWNIFFLRQTADDYDLLIELISSVKRLILLFGSIFRKSRELDRDPDYTFKFVYVYNYIADHLHQLYNFRPLYSDRVVHREISVYNISDILVDEGERLLDYLENTLRKMG